MMRLNQDAIFLAKVNAYIRGEITLSDLDLWVMINLRPFLPPRRDSISEVAGLIQLWVAERNQGHRTVDEVRELIAAYIREIPTITVTDAEMVTSGTASSALRPTVQVVETVVMEQS